MLIGISGTPASGKSEVVRYLTFQGFQTIDYKRSSGEDGKAADRHASTVFETFEELSDFVTKCWNNNYVLNNICDLDILETLKIKPFFLHISIDSPMLLRYERYIEKYSLNKEEFKIEDFVRLTDEFLYLNSHISVISAAVIKIINNKSLIEDLYVTLSRLDLMDLTRLRPSWDSYFMRLADLAAFRSNCMKRRVGCVIVRDNRVIATGYNGTPRGFANCNEGGCGRCNGSSTGSGAGLATCLCLHAEENALLESGKDRIGSGSILYCNTCPCLTCSIKIAQIGICEVVFSQRYLMDDLSSSVLRTAGIRIRQFVPAQEGVVVI
ncbi:deoxycytidine monophosphate deaminase ASCRUDRAFT_82749 [Ascoidea rubescens DSM 1968]|uniref:Deoxycytidylate deaminase n=1 Tax=Ascoidea rubescens DSM 1968 TaxID=1344418 RepID=A0A1D2VAC1_9ASCO|nr:hypothetical protein ASCRUDRAFT_82749 [Ascoidea rubescens DSM 1968]ODV58610.1 hypothetical protein ASCRUDRAFT_82749 [Ascoidea rubescens DSM 1968]